MVLNVNMMKYIQNKKIVFTSTAKARFRESRPRVEKC
jgi:hypothetical protein